jgi:hypothetical protein
VLPKSGLTELYLRDCGAGAAVAAAAAALRECDRRVGVIDLSETGMDGVRTVCACTSLFVSLSRSDAKNVEPLLAAVQSGAAPKVLNLIGWAMTSEQQRAFREAATSAGCRVICQPGEQAEL